VIELIVNVIQAIAAAPASAPGEITVTILREGTEDLMERIHAVHGFTFMTVGSPPLSG
jgi:hypothetical protein